MQIFKTKDKECYGKKYVDRKLCTQCGECQKVCPYDAVVFKGKSPLIDLNAEVVGHALITVHNKRYIQKMLRALVSIKNHVNN